ncbi:MAG: hypothetical protein EOP83_16255 [Verrucomicrobiaceae bacterium]|nr:MAG: hypothetical protein EOP83_16255 [Verrucomicrobiaceae bacterium]
MFEMSSGIEGSFPFIFFCLPRQRLSPTRLEIMEEAVHWCKDQFGPPALLGMVRVELRREGRWMRENEVEIGVRDEIDALAFRMRWC